MALVQLDVRPFEAIPGHVSRHLRADLVRAGEEIVAEEQGSERFRYLVLTGLEHFAGLVDDPVQAWERVCGRCVAAGRRLAREGRDLDEIHHALCHIGRVVWRSLSTAAETLKIDNRVLAMVADAQFVFMDALSAAITLGYQSEGDATPDILARRRSMLLALLLSERSVQEGEVEDAAARAQWRLPATAAAVVLSPRKGAVPKLVPEDVLVDWNRPRPCLLLPDPDGPGRHRVLEPLVHDWVVVVGLTVPLSQLAESVNWAEKTLALTEQGVIADRGLIRSADHVTSLVMFGAKNLLDTMADKRLGPLNGLPLVQRERLAETLLCMLANNFNATEVGKQLHLHAQTVRYRFRQIEALFGDELHDPQRCLELEMILRTRPSFALGA